MKVYYPGGLDLNGQQIINSLPEKLAAAPLNPVEARTYYDTILQKTRQWNGSAWVDLTSQFLGEVYTHEAKDTVILKTLEATDAAATAIENAEDSSVSALNAETSEGNALVSETKSKTSETNSKASEVASKLSETNSKTSETIATTKASESSTSATNSATSATNSATSATNAGLRKVETQAIKDAAVLAMTDTTNSTEMIEARKGKASLGEKINSIDANLADSANKSWLNISRTLMIGHRGLETHCPENTLKSIELAGWYGMDGVELDLSVTLDHEIVLMHDATIDRMTDGTGNTNALTLAQIKSYKIDAGNKLSYYPNIKVPTLEEALQVIRQYNLIPWLELKNISATEDIQKVIDTLVKWGFEFTVIVSGQTWNLDIVRAYNPNITVSPFTGKLDDTWLGTAKNYLPNVILGLEYSTLAQDDINLCHANGIRVDVWTINGNKDTYVNMYVDAIVGGV